MKLEELKKKMDAGKKGKKKSGGFDVDLKGGDIMQMFIKVENDIIVLESLTLDEIKTSKMAQILANLGVTEKALIVLPENDKNVVLSARNLRGVDTTFVGAINTYEVLGHTKCIITKDAVSKLEEVKAGTATYKGSVTGIPGIIDSEKDVM